MNVTAKALTLGLARALARAHADAGLQQFNSFQAAAHEAKRDPALASYLRYIHYAVPAATSLSFAAELFLKVIHFQHFGSYPGKCHDLVELFAALPLACRESMAATYAKQYGRTLPFEVVHFGLAAGPDANSTPRNIVPDLPTLDLALSHLRNVFNSWRYIYETMEVPVSDGVHFKALLAVIETANAQVDGHPGDSCVSYGSSAVSDDVVV